MGCDIEYYLDHDLSGLSAQEFLEEFKRRVTPLPVVLTGLPKMYPNMDWNKKVRHTDIMRHSRTAGKLTAFSTTLKHNITVTMTA